MNKKTIASFVGVALGAAVAVAPAHAQNVRIGLLGGISGPIAAMAPPMIQASQLAVAQINAQGGILKGGKLEVVVGAAPATRRMPPTPRPRRSTSTASSPPSARTARGRCWPRPTR